ncbi:venom serine protease Bi-VSP isoform X3 [Drosophila rhopaloa]|uniref:CLIP domain-containing serine protease n=1 Tax=Drosophila rhopaloa TaxID=1041015 RepID=A0ABM5J4T9_DRORH|nr:venom serine protease Bi-VSP isoform X3 [Drosophila rhopaloa]
MKSVCCVSAVITLLPLVLLSKPTDAQFNQRRQVRQNCITPENYYGSCVTLTYCPQVVNIFQTTNSDRAQRYLIALQRSCGTRNINGDPVICCTEPRYNQVTERPPNPFFPTENSFVGPQPPPEVPDNFFVNPTPRPTTTTTTTTTTTPAPIRITSSAPLVDLRGPSCRGPDTKPGNCVELKECAALLNELRVKQRDETFANFLRASRVVCGSQGTQVCCPNGQTVTTPAPVLPKNTDEVPRRLLNVEEGCGYTVGYYKKIVGGEVSRAGAWPWIALLAYDDASSSPFKCGGTLITARHVLTAAHCIRDDLQFVRLGEHDLSTDTETTHVDIKIAKYVAHPEYNRRNGRSDMAILYLEQNVEFVENKIAPICLPPTAILRQKSYVGYTPFVAGWGMTMEGGGSAKVLQELQIPIHGNDVCRETYAKERRYFSADQFDSAVICAGDLSGDKDMCQGGTPLMMPEQYQDQLRFYLIGVKSYGIGCARPNVPGVYSSTQYFMDWIIQQVQQTP